MRAHIDLPLRAWQVGTHRELEVYGDDPILQLAEIFALRCGVLGKPVAAGSRWRLGPSSGIRDYRTMLDNVLSEAIKNPTGWSSIDQQVEPSRLNAVRNLLQSL